MGKHIDGFVDAYYGPPEHSHRVDNEPLRDPNALAADARELLADVLADSREMSAQRRRWLGAQIKGVETSARKLGGADIAYADEVEACYGVRPEIVPEEAFEEAHNRLDDVLPGSGPLRDRLIAWREAQIVPVDVLPRALASVKDELQQQTIALYGLPAEEHIEFELVKNEPWSGFNYYQGGFKSRVAINTDLPMLAGNLAHLVAHEAYPGHHTEHSLEGGGVSAIPQTT